MSNLFSIQYNPTTKDLLFISWKKAHFNCKYFESWNTFRTGTNIHYPGNRNLEEGYGQLLPLLDTQEPLRTLKDPASDYDIDPNLKSQPHFSKVPQIYFFLNCIFLE